MMRYKTKRLSTWRREGKRYFKLHSKGKLWEAFTSEKQAVLLIDEIDKADIEFPNDLL